MTACIEYIQISVIDLQLQASLPGIVIGVTHRFAVYKDMAESPVGDHIVLIALYGEIKVFAAAVLPGISCFGESVA